MTHLFNLETPCIPGLTYIPNFITNEQERELITIIDQQPWSTELKRRVQHYGYKYDYKARRIERATYLGPLPVWLQQLAEALHKQGIFIALPDQVIVNEYSLGQGIAAHTDCIPCFTDTICSLSLGSPCVMELSKSTARIPLLLEPCSLLILQSEARYQWKHEIKARKSDVYKGQFIPRQRRLSLTFRKVIV